LHFSLIDKLTKASKGCDRSTLYALHFTTRADDSHATPNRNW